ncbi:MULTISPECIES: hypothetical protein [unclassified Roseovarius]|jgi:hypothetical protein|uniref:hypothetical protein n=1 Tax=unclassified Roseovarius TaxID=2614913 RepID=UPI0000685BA7|nr:MULTISPECIES: hypothetical protein [unclassified Roseovarius]EAQ26535.1 hypothetical protein ROS217_15201 [Roseovarius sp. 217]KJS40188.1 MAG: hypothetical protein VR71_24305 [Roseovarius sp. BRH_c41]
MKRITGPFMLCLLLALSMALGGIAAGRAAGRAVLEATLTELVICADGEGHKTVHLTRDGTPVELPNCTKMLCDHCLQAGAQATLGTAVSHAGVARETAGTARPGTALHHPSTVLQPRSRAPPAPKATV